MNAGFKMFAEKGFLRTHIGDIAQAAGKSNGVFHIYFRNKEALLDAWVDRCDEAVPWYQADTDLLFHKARRFILQSYWSLYERFGPILEALDAAAKVNAHFERRREHLRSLADASIVRLICHAQGEGRCGGIDPELTAVSIGAVICQTTAYWFAHRVRLEERGLDRVALIDRLDALYALMLEPDRTAGLHEIAFKHPVSQSAT